MMQQEMGECIVRMVVQLELKASSPPQLMWHSLESSSSRSEPLDVQLTASSVAIPNLHEGNDVISGQEPLADRSLLIVWIVAIRLELVRRARLYAGLKHFVCFLKYKSRETSFSK
jgi:hypothetical protein